MFVAAPLDQPPAVRYLLAQDMYSCQVEAGAPMPVAAGHCSTVFELHPGDRVRLTWRNHPEIGIVSCDDSGLSACYIYHAADREAATA